MKKLGLLQVCLGYLLLLMACGGGDNPPAGGGGVQNPPVGNPQAADVRGNWYLTLSSTAAGGSQATVDMLVKQTGGTIAAQLNELWFKGNPCSDYGTVSGTVSDNDISLTIQQGGIADQVKLTGTLSNGALIGTYTTSGPCTNGDAGNFSAQFVPSLSSGLWTGEAVSPASTVANFTVSLGEVTPAGNMAGSISFLDLPCTATIDLSAGQIGTRFAMTNSDLGWFGSGTVSADAKTVTGEYTMASLCGSEDTTVWTFTMSSP